MSEMSDMFKLVNAMELAKTARVGMELTYFDVIELLGEIKSLYEYIAELEAAQRWRVVADGELPDDDVEVFVLLYGSSVSTGKHYRNARHLDLEDNSYNLNYVIGDYWLIGDDEITYAQHCYNVVTHWMPLPSVPESEDK